MERGSLVRSVVGDALEVFVDANGGYSRKQAVRMGRRMSRARPDAQGAGRRAVPHGVTGYKSGEKRSPALSRRSSTSAGGNESDWTSAQAQASTSSHLTGVDTAGEATARKE